MAASTKTPSARAFRRAFIALEPHMTGTRRRILEVHYRALGRQLTMTQIAEAVGWKSYSSANSHYGRLARLVGEQVGFRQRGCHLATLCTFVRPQEKGDHWLIIMRKEVATALKSLGWFEAGTSKRGSTGRSQVALFPVAALADGHCSANSPARIHATLARTPVGNQP